MLDLQARGWKWRSPGRRTRALHGCPWADARRISTLTSAWTGSITFIPATSAPTSPRHLSISLHVSYCNVYLTIEELNEDYPDYDPDALIYWGVEILEEREQARRVRCIVGASEGRSERRK